MKDVFSDACYHILCGLVDDHLFYNPRSQSEHDTLVAMACELYSQQEISDTEYSFLMRSLNRASAS